MKALVVERYSIKTQLFMEGLHATTYCRVHHAQTVDEGLRTMRQEYFDLALVTMERQMGPASRIFEEIRLQGGEHLNKCPHVIFLSEQPDPVDAVRCADLGTRIMLRQYAEPTYFEAGQIFRKLAARPLKSTVRIDFQGGHHTAYLAFGSEWDEIEGADRLQKTVANLGGGKRSYSVEWLADALGVCRQSVKQYISLLNQKVVNMQLNHGIDEPDRDIFWMSREPGGGTLCGVAANIVWTGCGHNV